MTIHIAATPRVSALAETGCPGRTAWVRDSSTSLDRPAQAWPSAAEVPRWPAQRRPESPGRIGCDGHAATGRKRCWSLIVASGFCIVKALKQAHRLSQFGIAESPA